jgi:hypothetical protein
MHIPKYGRLNLFTKDEVAVDGPLDNIDDLLVEY